MNLWDDLSQLVLNRENRGSWVGFVFVVAFIVLAIWWVENKLSVRDHNAQIQTVVNEANSERDVLLKQIELRDKDMEAMKAEVAWARNREQHHIKERKRLESENAELTKLLNTKLPADLYR